MSGGRQTPAMAFYLPNTCDGREIFIRGAFWEDSSLKEISFYI
jgi:hypothetical protein